MRSKEAERTVIVVSARPSLQNEADAHSIRVQWAHSIRAAMALIDVAPGDTVVITELALKDGNWRDLTEEVMRRGKPIPVALASPIGTSELWWEALERGIDDILRAPLTITRIQEYLDKVSK